MFINPGERQGSQRAVVPVVVMMMMMMMIFRFIRQWYMANIAN
jgi:hypothetical protein